MAWVAPPASCCLSFTPSQVSHLPSSYSYAFHRTFVSPPAGFQCCLNHVNIFSLPSPSLILFSCTISFACLSLLHHIPHHLVPSIRPALPTLRRMSLHNGLISCPHKGFSAIDFCIPTIFFLSFLSLFSFLLLQRFQVVSLLSICFLLHRSVSLIKLLFIVVILAISTCW